ncbi:MAG TPA: hypothetical protein VNX87_20265 [Candidatus Sulfotelmatobacter sp.]|nr:hypothetical protein [Candidatus Sulfotelmatobacter sp.]
MIYNEEPGVRAELIRVANQMRKDNDPISDDDKGRIHSYFSTTVGTDAELREVVSAAPPDEVWATYEWVSPPASEASDLNKMEARFIQASIDEVSGKREDALQIYRSLDQELKQRKDSGPRISQRVRDAVQRLSH